MLVKDLRYVRVESFKKKKREIGYTRLSVKKKRELKNTQIEQNT